MTEGFDLPALAAAVRAHGPVVRVVVAAARGSTPREAGAAMLVWDGPGAAGGDRPSEGGPAGGGGRPQPGGGRTPGAQEAPGAPDAAPPEPGVAAQRAHGAPGAGPPAPGAAAQRTPGAPGAAPPAPGAAAGQSGTIGGGALEWEAAAAARRLPRSPWARALVRLPLGPMLGQCCGGHVTLLLERFGPEEIAFLEAHPPGPFVRPTASGAAPDPGALAALRARRAARAGEGPPGPRLAGGLLAEPLAEPASPVWLYGAGHVGRAIVRAAEGLPLAITWVDTAPERFPDPVPGHAARLVAADPARAAAHAPPDAVHLVLTHSHALDLAICHAVLARPHRHLGLIGSASKRARFLGRLRALGLPEAALARLHCPIGDRRLGKRPAAVALGVVAELLLLAAAPAAAAAEARA